MDTENAVWVPGKNKESIMKQMIFDCLSYYKGNKIKAAKALGISRRCIIYSVVKYGLREFMSKTVLNEYDTPPEVKEYNAMLKVQSKYNATIN